MIMEKTFNELTYVICHNGADIVHPSKVEKGVTLTSGQPEYEEFLDEESWKKRLVELGFNVASLEPPALKSFLPPTKTSKRAN